VLDHVVTHMDVAAGGYPIDVQTLRPSDDGFVFGAPEIYGGRLCMTVPRDVGGLWVVGKAAGYDPLAHASARVVPFGMAMAEAVGVAAAFATVAAREARVVVDDPAFVTAVRRELEERGAYLPPVRPRAAAGPTHHPHYGDYREMLRWGLAVGGYDNDPRLDAAMSRTGLLYLLSNVLQRVHRDEMAGARLIARFGLNDGPLAATEASAIVAEALCGIGRCPEGEDWAALQAVGLPHAKPVAPLTRGNVYALVALLSAERSPGYEHALGRR
jgi:hypothetical protein